jgi:toxin-antitoxin system PIN domain toxin
LDADHIHKPRAHAWWSGNRENGWASCPLTQNGFIRVVSQQTYPSPIPIGRAFSHLRQNVETADHEFWPDDLSLLDEQLIDHSRVLGPKQLTDIYLLALAVRRKGRLVTFDRSISIAAVREATPEHLVVL